MGLLRNAADVYNRHGLTGLCRKSVKFFADNPQYFSYAITNAIFRLRYGKGTDVMSEDWDNLIILDACRYDAFKDRNTVDGDLQRRVSRGSSSLEFIEGNFTGRTLHDTVYVTANTYYTAAGDDTFHSVITCFDHWDEDLQTVPPSGVVEESKQAFDRNPNKRLIMHFMQPHAPYIGSTGQELRDKIERDVDVRGMTIERGMDDWDEPGDEPDDGSRAIQAIQAPAMDGIDVTDEEVREAYDENLDVVLARLEELLSHLEGKTVITADHGELIGDRVPPLFRKRYEHPIYLHTSELCLVPWLVIDDGERRTITSDPPERYDSVDEADLKEKLRAFGYR
ncbi:hypothetical protein [Halostagnicola bangensis]